jgi:hypothetical protein
MKNKSIITEIYRINQMMNNNDIHIILENLIFEGTGTGKTIERLAEKLKLYKSENEIIKVIERYAGTTSQPIERRLENFITLQMRRGQPGYRVIKNMIREAADVSSKYADEFVKEYEEAFTRLSEQPVYKGKTQEFLQKLEDNYGLSIREAWERLKKIPDSDIKIKDTKIRNFAIRAFTYFRKYWLYSLINSTNKLDTVIIPDTIKQMNAKYAEGKTFYFEADDLFTQIIALGKKWDVDFGVNYNKYVTNNTSIDINVRRKLKEIYENDPMFSQTLKSKYLRSQEAYWGPVKFHLARELEKWPLLKAGGLMLRGVEPKNWKQDVFTPDVKSWMNKILWKDARGIADVVESMAVIGRDRVISQKLIGYVISNFIIVPTMVAYVKMVKDNIGENIGMFSDSMKNWESLRKLTVLAYGKDSTQVKELDEKKPQLPSEKEFIDYWKDSLPIAFGNANPYGEPNAPLWLKLTKNAFFWTYVDDILAGIYQAMKFTATFKMGDDDVQRIKDYIDKRGLEDIKDLPCYDSSLSPRDNIIAIEKCTTENAKNIIIDIQKDIKPAAPCLFTNGWTVDLVTLNGVPTYVTHNEDWTQKYYLHVIKKDNVTNVYYKTIDENGKVTNTTDYVC